MNNWLNVPAQPFLYPEFPSSSAPLNQRAQFTHLKKVYDQDKLTLLKSSRLTRKSVRPQPIERQNVKRALVNFDSSTIASLQLYASHDPNAYMG
ncbi:hypothetical protein RvY_00269 [Ramazzottius varieornatus]|uniref:Uncharacterized protein n=1 Tax=Ramazzottius varieornatus TaxID=947166 RepID=A0A1D1UMP4_RAMVA|nr:hypothetical protein RvY_00269 [Ramazzottius varieornatus]